MSINTSLSPFQEFLEQKYLFKSFFWKYTPAPATLWAPDSGIFRSWQRLSNGGVWNTEWAELNNHQLLILSGGKETIYPFLAEDCIYQEQAWSFQRGSSRERSGALKWWMFLINRWPPTFDIPADQRVHCPCCVPDHRVLEKGGKPNRNVSFFAFSGGNNLTK